MHNLATLSFNVLKADLPQGIVVEAKSLKKLYVAAQQPNQILQFLSKCLELEVVPVFLREKIPKRFRAANLFNSMHSTVIQNEITLRQEQAKKSQLAYEEAERRIQNDKKRGIVNIAIHFSKRDLNKNKDKYNDQLISLITYKSAINFKMNNTVETQKSIKHYLVKNSTKLHLLIRYLYF